MNTKKSFVLYADQLSTVEKLPDEVAGKLLKLILRFENGIIEEPDDLLLQIAFEPIKRTLIRNGEKYDAFRQKQSENGKKGGRPTKEGNPKNPSLSSETQKSLSTSVSTSDSISDSISDIYFYIKKKKIKKKVSEWFLENFRDFLQNWESKYKSDITQEVLTYMDDQHNNKNELLPFDNNNHIKNVFMMTWKTISKKNETEKLLSEIKN